MKNLTETAKISIIIPVYNIEQYLHRCLDSIINQTLKEIEIIIVNDGSTDKSLAIIHSYQKEDPRIILINQKNLGLSAARNSGIKISTGKYLSFVDSDDFIDLNMLYALYDKAEIENSDIVQFEYQRFNEEKGVFFKSHPKCDSTFENLLSGHILRAAWNKIYKKSLFIENNITYPNNLFHEDIPTTTQLFYKAKKIVHVSEPYYYWYYRNDSISAQISTKHILDVFSGQKIIAQFLIKNDVFERYQSSFLKGFFLVCNSLAERVNHFKISTVEKQSLLQEICISIKRFEYCNNAKRDWLKKHNPELYERIHRNLFMIEPLLDKSKDQLIHELNQANLRLYYQQQGGKKWVNYVNYDFSCRLNKLYGSILNLQEKYKKIAIYGNGLAGQIVAQRLGESVVVIVDQDAPEQSSHTTLTVCKPEALNQYDFDCIIICVLGREEGIKYYLENTLGISSHKIVSFNLYDDTASKVSEIENNRNYQQLTSRIEKKQPLIGAHPLSVQIQTVSTCNAKCYFCPYPGSWHDNNPGRMTDAHYKKIIDGLAHYKIKKFCPYLENEPLLDKKLFTKLQYAIDILQPETVEIASNLSILSEYHLDGLINVLAKVPHELRISFHGIDKESYEEVMQLDFEKSLNNVKRVVEAMQYTPLNVKIRGSGEPRTKETNIKQWFGEVEFRKFWQKELQGFTEQPSIDFFTYHDRAGQSQLKDKGIDFDVQRESLKDFYCNRYDQWVHFLYTGEPILCCMDYNRETIFDESIENSSVEEIFNSSNFIKLIKQGTGLCHSSDDFICKRCISPGG